MVLNGGKKRSYRVFKYPKLGFFNTFLTFIKKIMFLFSSLPEILSLSFSLI